MKDGSMESVVRQKVTEDGRRLMMREIWLENLKGRNCLEMRRKWHDYENGA
jgi:hypothetical protein